MMRALILTATIAFGVADITPVQDDVTIKEKLMEMLQQHDTAVSFDTSITDEIAHSIYKKYSTANNNNNKKGIKIGQRRSLNKNRKSLLDDDGWDNTDKQSVLDLHNDYRSNLASGNEADDGTDGTYPAASNMNKLFWDDALASVAQAYSDTCVWGHNSDRNDEFYDYEDLARFDYPSSDIYLGENIAIFYTTSDTIYDYYLTNRVGAWWNESTSWHYETYTSAASAAGHFSQMAWADTRYLGCGFSYCQDGSWNTYYLVCNYYTGGNFQNEYPYSQGSCSISSTCDGDRTICQDSLCGGCMDPGFIESDSTSDNTDCNGTVFYNYLDDTTSTTAPPSPQPTFSGMYTTTDEDDSDSDSDSSGGTYTSTSSSISNNNGASGDSSTSTTYDANNTSEIGNTDDSGISPGDSSGVYSLTNGKQMLFTLVAILVGFYSV